MGMPRCSSANREAGASSVELGEAGTSTGQSVAAHGVQLTPTR
jgi:hypothetical protein